MLKLNMVEILRRAAVNLGIGAEERSERQTFDDRRFQLALKADDRS